MSDKENVCPPCWNISEGTGMKDFEKAKKSKHIAEIMDSMKSVTAKEGYIRNLRYLLMFFLWHTKIF